MAKSSAILLPLLLLVASPVVRAQGSLPLFAQSVDQMLRQSDMVPASVGICVMDVASGQVLYAYDPDRALATASTMKAITTATALATLGPGYRFETKIALGGRLADGILEGDLLIVGSGDPTLGSDRLRSSDGQTALLAGWVEAIRQAGIREIRGAIIGDDSYFPTQMTPGNWGWEDMGNYYGAGASGLNFDENLYQLHFSSGAPGTAATLIGTEPEMPLLFVNEVLAGPAGSGDNAYIFGAPYTQLRYVRGSIPPNKSRFTIKGSMPDPALFCAQQLGEALKAAGLPVGQPASTSRLRALAGKPLPQPGQVVHVHQSAPLADIAQATNFSSINLYAEAIACRLAVFQRKPGLSGEGAAMMEGYWSGQGVNTRGMRPQDGSGLSPNNVVTARQFAEILTKAARAPYAASYLASLPVAGQSGAMKSSMAGTVAEGKVRAKSGYIAGVRGYVGYADLPDGRRVAFAMLANHFEGSPGTMKSRWETLMVQLVQGR